MFSTHISAQQTPSVAPWKNGIVLNKQKAVSLKGESVVVSQDSATVTELQKLDAEEATGDILYIHPVGKISITHFMS